jgi:hypothetical protein
MSGVRMTHPDVAGEIVVASSAVPIHENSGWKAVPGQEDMGERLPPDAQRFDGQEQVRMRHPNVADMIVVARSAVPSHRSVGWVEIDDEAEAKAAYDDQTVTGLQEEARSRGLKVSGT